MYGDPPNLLIEQVFFANLIPIHLHRQLFLHWRVGVMQPDDTYIRVQNSQHRRALLLLLTLLSRI